MGPKAGINGGYVIAKGTINDIENNENSIIGGFVSEKNNTIIRKSLSADEIFDFGKIHLETNRIHTVKPLKVDIPKGRLTCITGVSGSGKTTMVLESLVPALEALTSGKN